MATVSEFLNILIGFDVPKLKAEASKVNKELSETDKKANDLMKSFGKAKNAAMGFFATLAGTGAISAFIANVVGADAALNRLSKTTGMSVENISAWSNAAEHMGGSASEMQAGIAGISKEMTKFKYTGDSTLVPFLNQMGVNILDNNGKMKDQTQIMLELADQAQKMPKEDFSNLASMNGFNQSQINLMLQGRKALEAQLKEQNKNNLVTKQQAEEAAKAEAAWVDLKQSFMGVARAVAYVLIPPLIGVAKVLTAMFTYIGNHKETLGVLFLFAIPKLLAFNKGFLILLRYMTGITPVLKLATFAMRGFGLSTMIALAPLLLIGTGLGLLLDDFLTFQAGGDSWIPWDKIFGGAKEAITYIKDVVFSLDRLKDLLKALATGDWEMAKNIGKDIIGGLTPTAIAAGISKQQQQGGTQALQNGDYQVMSDDEIEAQKKKEAGQIDLKQIDDMAGRANEKIKSVASTAMTTAGQILTGFGAFRFGGGVDEHIHEASQRYGIPEDELRGFAKIENGWTGKDSNTGAVGVGQFTMRTWNGLAKTAQGQKIGMTPVTSANKWTAKDPRRDKHINTLAMGLLAQENAGYLKRAGVPVTGDNLYMVHNIGPGVIPALKGSNNVSSGVLDSMRKNGMKRGMSATDFVKWQKANYQRHYNIANKGASFSKGNGDISSMSSSELANFASPSMPVGAKAHHALKHGGNATHNTINSSTVIHKVNIVADKAEQAGKSFLQEMQKARELKNPWWKAAQYNNTAMQ